MVMRARAEKTVADRIVEAFPTLEGHVAAGLACTAVDALSRWLDIEDDPHD